MFFYYDEEREDNYGTLPNVEVFYLSHFEARYTDEETAPGWYYWYCFPGCLPDSDPIGPYDTEEEALEAAREE